MATDFSLESVRQFMLAYEGKVTNHDLVKHYKAWLTHPTEKESARQRFKEYVNTLSSIKVEDGVKYLVLKKRYYPTFADPSPQNTGGGSSLLDEVMSSWSATQARRQLPPTPSSSTPSYYGRPQQPPAYHQAPPPPPSYRAPPPPVRPDFGLPSDLGLPLPSDYGLPTPRQGLFHPPGPSSLTNYEQRHNPYAGQVQPQYAPQMTSNVPPPLPRRNEAQTVQMLSRSSSVMSNSHPYDLGAIGRSMSVQDNLERSIPPPLPTRNNMVKEHSPSLSSSSAASMTSLNSSRKPSISEDKENQQMSEMEKVRLQNQIQEKISVKERTKTFNRMASEVELSNGGAAPKIPALINNNDLASSKKRKNSKSARGSSTHRDELDSHDSSSISTLDQAAKQWMVTAAKGDYISLVKMLREDSRLAKAKDFTSGYTALHWAAKHGNLDMVKLLAGNYSVNVNAKSHGGYTPLHLACQFGHTEAFDLLVKAYGADSNLRDNAGKKPRQYLQLSAGNAMNIHMSNDTFRQLKDRRRNRNRQLADKNSGILRFGSLSVKVKKTTEALNSYFGKAAEQPYSLPTIGANDHDSSKMPPPKFAPIKKRRSKRAADFQPLSMTRSAPVTPHENSPIKEEMGGVSDSDSEYGFDSQWNTPSATQNR